MSLTNGENGMVMPVSPMYGGGNGGFGGWGGDGAWWLLILLFALGGWGNNGFGGGFGGGDGVLPYMWNTATQNDVNRGFDTAAIAGQLSGIQTSVSNGFANAEVAECNRAMADMQAGYANTQAITNQLTSMQMAQQQCCCDNRASIADLKYTIATEACADRAAVNEGVRDIIANQTAGIQTILDKLCQQEIDALKTQNANLQTQVNMANLAASQTAQTAAIRAGQVAEIDAMYQRLKDCPVPTMPVYGMQPIFTCGGNNGCGCGYGGFNGNF